MARPTHDALALVTLATASLLGMIALSTIPARAARFTPEARRPSEIVRPSRRPPTPRTPAVSNAAVTEAAPPTGPVTTVETTQGRRPARVTRTSEEEVLEIVGFSGGTGTYEGDDADWYYSPEGYAWQRRMFYRRREWQARWSRWTAERRGRVRSWLSPGSANDAALSVEQAELRDSVCGVFPAACASGVARAGGGARTMTPPLAEPVPATVRRRGNAWVLANGITETVIDLSGRCALQVQRAGEQASPPLTFDTPDESPCGVVETAAPDAMGGGAAVAVTWRGNGWWQQAVVSLGDEAESPEASVTRVETTREGRQVTTLANLTGTSLTWTIAGHEVAVPSGQTAERTR